MPPRRSPSSSRSGGEAERRARRYYRLRGYRVLETNARPGRNEVDLVLRRGRTLVFCEVKSKGGMEFGDPAEMVGTEKQRRVRAGARAWLAAHPEAGGLQVRFDVLAVGPGGLEHIANAF